MHTTDATKSTQSDCHACLESSTQTHMNAVLGRTALSGYCLGNNSSKSLAHTTIRCGTGPCIATQHAVFFRMPVVKTGAPLIKTACEHKLSTPMHPNPKQMQNACAVYRANPEQHKILKAAESCLSSTNLHLPNQTYLSPLPIIN